MSESNKNNKEQFREWLIHRSEIGSNKPNSYIKAMEILSEILKDNLFENNNLELLGSLRTELIKEQKNSNGKFFYSKAPSYGKNGFYSASVQEYINFLEQLIYSTGENLMPSNNNHLNQILYGPPGTGKTYNTITKALAIIDGTVPSERKEAKAKFEEYRKSGQIEFITFHQSYGYEEFVEGIRAIPVGEEGNEDGEEMIYAVKDGIFKRMSKKSLENYTKNNHTVSKKRKFLLHAKTLNIQAEMIEEDSNTYRVLKGSKIRKGQAASFENYNYVALKNKLLGDAKLKEETEFYILEEDYIFQSMSAASSVILGRQSNGYNDWKEIGDESNLFTQDREKRNYILIIDEINRGNISKIFGELITLIEPSKRIGADEAIKLQLPYSNEEFGVPQNLYIIGTMNTADRSIALMDTALRRRFHFEEMMPNLETLSEKTIEGIDLKKILTKINQRVEYLYDRDHTIGHAYFIDVEGKDDLDNVMLNKILPLLQEYFYDDWEKILMVLGDGFVDKIEVKSDIFDYKPDEYLEDEKFIYSIKKSFDYTKLQS